MEISRINRIKTLVKELNQESALYYNGKQSNMNDKEWDDKYNQLEILQNRTNFTPINSPTVTVGYEVINSLEKVRHNKEMLSLDKTKDINELIKFLGNKEGVLSWKEDGLTIVLTYDNNILVDAVTRGGGDVGSRVLHNAKVFKGIPQQINYGGKLVIRGEALISREDFEIINVDGEYANPRNLASGSIMQLDNKITKQRNIQFKAFGIVECDKSFELYTSQLDWLSELGFDSVEYKIVNSTTLESNVLLFKEKISEYSFATDGLVVMFQDLKFGKSLGGGQHHENNAFAFKWEDANKETILRDIKFQIGRTGILTPVAYFDKVEIEQSMVGKASLHNISILRNLELGISDKILVYKANMIIPQLSENLTKSNSFILPTSCPVCGGDVELRTSDRTETLHCINPNCNAKLSQTIKHFCSKKAMDITDFSIKTIEKFIEKGFIKDITDVYKIEQYKEKIINMDGFGIKSYNNLIKSLEDSKRTTLAKFIYSLGISNVGSGSSKDLQSRFKTIDGFRNCTFNDLILMNDMGEITSTSIIDYLNSETNQVLMDELLQYIKFEEEVRVKVKEGSNENKLFGCKVYCTGVFSLKKAELKVKLAEIGCTFESGYKKSLDYLICGDTSKSGKKSKAEADGIKIMYQDEMNTYLK